MGEGWRCEKPTEDRRALSNYSSVRRTRLRDGRRAKLHPTRRAQCAITAGPHGRNGLERTVAARARRGVTACLLLASLVAAPLAHPSPTLDRIKSEGAIRLGYRAGAAPFS